jgi:hypothetical protein
VRIGDLGRAEAPAIVGDLRTWLLERAGATHISIGQAAGYTLRVWDRSDEIGTWLTLANIFGATILLDDVLNARGRGVGNASLIARCE